LRLRGLKCPRACNPRQDRFRRLVHARTTRVNGARRRRSGCGAFPCGANAPRSAGWMPTAQSLRIAASAAACVYGVGMSPAPRPSEMFGSECLGPSATKKPRGAAGREFAGARWLFSLSGVRLPSTLFSEGAERGGRGVIAAGSRPPLRRESPCWVRALSLCLGCTI
jgi:hypothetical protein